MLPEITTIFPDRILVRGHNICALASTVSFGDVIYLLAKGVLPSGNEGKLIEAMLICCCDHGINAPSTLIARSTASCGVPLQAALAAGVNSIGDYHGGAGEELARALQEHVAKRPHSSNEELAYELIDYFVAQGKRVPGFGHRQHNPDPRAVTLVDLGRKWNISDRYTDLVEKISAILQATRSEKLHLNVDGALAALISDMGLHWRYAKSIFIISRLAGLSAHVIEEFGSGSPLAFIKKVQMDK